MKTKTVQNKWSWLLLCLSAVALLAFGSTRDSGPRTQADRIDAITKVLACPTCSGESVYVCVIVLPVIHNFIDSAA